MFLVLSIYISECCMFLEKSPTFSFVVQGSCFTWLKLRSSSVFSFWNKHYLCNRWRVSPMKCSLLSLAGAFLLCLFGACSFFFFSQRNVYSISYGSSTIPNQFLRYLLCLWSNLLPPVLFFPKCWFWVLNAQGFLPLGKCVSMT